MAPKFGTSGLRGLVSDLTPDLISDYTRAFILACPTGGAVHVGWDLRASSPQIAQDVIAAATGQGVQVVACGAVSTPALALGAMQAGHAAIMVTGSHIPDDRNGLKFYIPTGEIGKAQEAEILGCLGQGASECAAGRVTNDPDCFARYVARYLDAFGADALAGLRIGVYQHSSVARDVLSEIVSSLGAVAVPLARSDRFIPVDTEAVPSETRQKIRDWCRADGLDALISTDGDADRPMLAGTAGEIIPGDVLGVLTARAIGADRVVTPVSSNSMVSEIPEFTEVRKTRIGSPYVIAAMEDIRSEDPQARVVGYEANGGFLLGFTVRLGTGDLSPLMTRDSLLPLVAPLWAARRLGRSIDDLAAALPQRFTAADRLANVPTQKTAMLIDTLCVDDAQRRAFFEEMGNEISLDMTDGLRVTFSARRIVHLRPSGNAPECRSYAEAETEAEARHLVSVYLAKLAQALA